MEYSNEEMTDMHFVYGMANGNSAEAARMYAEMYPQRVAPHHTLFLRLHQRLRENGTFKKRTYDCGRHREVRTPALEEAVIQIIEEQPETSTRKISLQLDINHMTVFAILKEQLLYPYHLQRVQALLPRDFPNRLAFSNWILEKTQQNPGFLQKVLFTDEASFSKVAIINFHNNHIWADENPHALVEAHHQEQFSLNVWIGIIGNHLIGPHFLPPRLNGNTYTHFLREELPMLLEDVPLAVRNEMWFMHDGAPAHFSLMARQHLDEAFENRWIGRGGTQFWPARSPDLNPLDFATWGHLKSLVYQTPVQNAEDLRNRIVQSCIVIKDMPGIFTRIRRSMQRRIVACAMAQGGHFQHFL